MKILLLFGVYFLLKGIYYSFSQQYPKSNNSFLIFIILDIVYIINSINL